MTCHYPRCRTITLCQVVLSLLSSSPLFSAPIFENSVVSNEIDFIRSDDPSVPFQSTSLGQARKEMPDKRSDELLVDGVSAFQVRYEDGCRVEIWVVPALEDGGVNVKYVSLVGAALGKLPAALRDKLSHVVIHSGDETAFAEEEGRFFVLYSKNIDRRVSTHDLEETVFHETIHATLEAEHARSPGWIRVQKSDPGFITDYAEKHPQKEDLPESALFAFALLKSPGRMPAKVERAVREIMPGRLEYLRELFDSLEEEPRSGRQSE